MVWIKVRGEQIREKNLKSSETSLKMVWNSVSIRSGFDRAVDPYPRIVYWKKFLFFKNLFLDPKSGVSKSKTLGFTLNP
jgi:hypothetical protein